MAPTRRVAHLAGHPRAAVRPPTARESRGGRRAPVQTLHSPHEGRSNDKGLMTGHAEARRSSGHVRSLCSLTFSWCAPCSGRGFRTRDITVGKVSRPVCCGRTSHHLRALGFCRAIPLQDWTGAISLPPLRLRQVIYQEEACRQNWAKEMYMYGLSCRISSAAPRDRDRADGRPHMSSSRNLYANLNSALRRFILGNGDISCLRTNDACHRALVRNASRAVGWLGGT